MSSLSKTRGTIRSISLPTRSHPTTLQVEEELTNLKTLEALSTSSSVPTSDTICNGLLGLQRLYICVENLLSLPLTQKALSHYQYEKLVDELLDRWMGLLDLCDTIKDAVTLVKEHVRDVQSALRRRKGDFIMDVLCLKKQKKDSKRAIATLKQIDHKIGGTMLLNLDHHLSSVIRVLRDVSEVSILALRWVLAFLSVSVSKPKSTTKWSKVSTLIQKGTTEIFQISSDDQDCHIECIENSLECMSRSLIRTRASLLNILSHY